MFYLDSPIVIFLHLTFSFTELWTREFKFFPMFHMLPSFFSCSNFLRIGQQKPSSQLHESFFK